MVCARENEIICGRFGLGLTYDTPSQFTNWRTPEINCIYFPVFQYFIPIMSILLKTAHPDQIPGLIDFLQKAKLPTTDLPSDLSGFTLAMDGTQIMGSAGVELLGNIGLLRSVAVADTHRNQKLGHQLFMAAMEYARTKQVQEVFLITESADLYFEKKGFQQVDRSDVPDEITQTKQFASLCPSSAVVMKLKLP